MIENISELLYQVKMATAEFTSDGGMRINVSALDVSVSIYISNIRGIDRHQLYLLRRAIGDQESFVMRLQYHDHDGCRLESDQGRVTVQVLGSGRNYCVTSEISMEGESFLPVLDQIESELGYNNNY